MYSAALREYVARHAPDEVTARLDVVVAEAGDAESVDISSRIARRTLEFSEW